MPRAPRRPIAETMPRARAGLTAVFATSAALALVMFATLPELPMSPTRALACASGEAGTYCAIESTDGPSEDLGRVTRAYFDDARSSSMRCLALERRTEGANPEMWSCVFPVAGTAIDAEQAAFWERLDATIDGETASQLTISEQRPLPEPIPPSLIVLAIASLVALVSLVLVAWRSRVVDFELDEARLELHRISRWLGLRRSLGVVSVADVRGVRSAPTPRPAIEVRCATGIVVVPLPYSTWDGHAHLQADEIAASLEKALVSHREESAAGAAE